MMKDSPITTNNDYSSFNDEYLFEFILHHYYSYNQTNIRRLWKYKYFLDFEEEEVEEDDIDEINNMNLSLIKNTPLIFIILMNMILMIIVLQQCTSKI